ncbi:type II toxin-antitoxin system RelE/ParE family toxin [Methylobacterium oryzihabitans]|uniref:Type II toxin-antitoxin system RelE/ParE family toxin n=1 Tax=Methylobacterium oryzihabitans TaxID=2499852 RepID=A0A437P3S5_9HYPH|nr:type II toxin-antitoxin system RelE/ParE family toxin [Methylobacterium oryzihabitans]
MTRRPLAREDLIEIWTFVADDNEAAADALLDRIERGLRMLAANPQAGRARPELRPGLRSFPIGTYVVFYVATDAGIEVVRVRSGYRDLAPDDVAC